MNTFWQFMKRNYKVVLLITALSAILWSFMPNRKEDPGKRPSFAGAFNIFT